MSLRLFIALVAFTFAGTVVCKDLKCYHCASENKPQGGAEKYCDITSPSQIGNNTVQNCSTEGYCMIMETVNKDGLITDFIRNCGNNNSCADTGCQGGKDGAPKHCRSCCNTELCNGVNSTIMTPTANPTSGTLPHHASFHLTVYVVCFALILGITL